MFLLRRLSGRIAASALLALTTTSLALAQTQAPYTVFHDTFTGGSTINSNPTSPAVPSTNAAAYQVISSQAAYPAGTPTLSTSSGLRLGVDSSAAASGFLATMAQAIFNQNPVKLATDNDYIELTTVFTAETALLTDSTNATAANATFVLTGLYNTTVTATGTTANRDTIVSPETTPPTSVPLSAYVHQPTPAIPGGQLGVNSGNNLGNFYPAYWRGYTSRHYRTSGRSQAYVHVWTGTTSTNNIGNDTALNPTTTSTLAPLTAGQQYTAVFRITRQPRSSTSAGVTTTTTQLVLKHDLYAGAVASGTPLSTYTTSAVSSNSQHAGVVYDSLSVGFRLNGNGTNGSSQIMAVNSIRVVTTGKTIVAPFITTQPASQNASWGDPATFTVVASGGGDVGGELSYQWKKNGMDIAGETSASYTIPVLDYSNAGTYTVAVTNAIGTVTSAGAVLVVNPPAPPTIATGGDPVSQNVASGSSASFTVTGAGAGLTYKWQKSTDGTTFTDIPGATSRTYTIARTQGSSVGFYRGVVMNTSGSATSAAAALTLFYNFTGITPSGYASSATGGDTATAVEVSNLTDFKAQAESASAAVITVNGTINLGGKVSVKSNKTIQGKDGEATLIGNLELASGVSNVVIRGLNITNPAGSGLTITGASNVYINHVSFYDCSDTLLAITGGADNVTVSWSEFYYSAANDANKAVLVGNSTETKPISVTFDHNWWSDNVETHMPETTYGRVHMYNNLFRNEAGTAMGNTTGTRVRANAQLFSERNQYIGIASPLTKEASNIGLVRTIGDIYTSSTGTAAYAGGDFTTFAPPYSYQMMSAGSVSSTVASSAGNLAGASTATPAVSGTASVTSTATTVPLGGSFTLTAVPNGLTVAPDVPVPPYQWRLNGVPIGAATISTTLTVTQATGSNTGNYTVAILLANGDTVVSTPITITATSGSSAVPSSNSAASGGGAPSLWFMGALGLIAALRRFFRR